MFKEIYNFFEFEKFGLFQKRTCFVKTNKVYINGFISDIMKKIRSNKRLIKNKEGDFLFGFKEVEIIIRFFGFLIFVFGMIIILNSFFGITGFSISKGMNKDVGSLLGLILEVIGALLMFIRTRD